MIKRLFDLTLSSLILILTFPAAAIIALLIKLESKGPVIFKQKRVGQNGKEFIMYKFRTMFMDTPPYMPKPMIYDERITPFGRFLRKTALDELPQLWNVLRGEMSLVGPRPEMPFIAAEYNDEQRKRLSAKSGITGLWQINRIEGEPIHKNIEYDLYYLKNKSLLLDLKILSSTILWLSRRLLGFALLKIYHGLNIFLNLLGIFAILRFVRRKILKNYRAIILLYHRVGNYKFVPYELYATLPLFEKQIRYLLKREYRIVPLDELKDIIVNGGLKEDYAAITFDDGFSDTFLNAYPLLKKYNLPATVFLVANEFEGGNGIVEKNSGPKLT